MLGMGGVPARLPSVALLRKCARLQIAGSRKGLAWKAVVTASSAYGTARTEAQRLRLLFCLANSNFIRRLGGPCQIPSVIPALKV